MGPNQYYQWEMELDDGTVRRQYDDDGRERTWKDLPPERIVRVSFLPRVPLLPSHHAIIDTAAGERFVRRFARGKMRGTPQGFLLREYVNCLVTTRYRLWSYHDGRVIVTRPDYDGGGRDG